MAGVIDKVIKRGLYNAPSNTAGLCMFLEIHATIPKLLWVKILR